MGCYELNLFTEYEGKDCGGSKHSNYDLGSLQRWNHHNDFQRTINGVAYEWDKTAEGCMEICIAVGPDYCTHFTIAGSAQCDMVVNSAEKEDASGYICYELVHVEPIQTEVGVSPKLGQVVISQQVRYLGLLLLLVFVLTAVQCANKKKAEFEITLLEE